MNRIYLLIMLVLVLVGGVLTSCSPESKNREEASVSISELLHDVSAMKYLKADIDSSTEYIGRQNLTTRSFNSGSMKLVKQDGDTSDVTPIAFKIVKDKDENGKDVEGFGVAKLTIGDIVNQEVINGKLDKVYVTDDYTFVSYVTVDIERILQNTESDTDTNIRTSISGKECIVKSRWSESSDYIELSYHYGDESYSDKIYYKPSRYYESATNESDGVSSYDTHGYYTNAFRQSFIIDNNTGLIYSVDERSFFLQRGVAIDSKLGPVSIKTNDDGTLRIEQLVGNPNIDVRHVFKDKYDQYYVCCDINEKTDNVIFFSKGIEYIPTKTGEVIHFIFTAVDTVTIKNACVIGDDFKETPLTDKDVFDLYYSSLINYNVKNDYQDFWWDYYNPKSSDWDTPYSERQYYLALVKCW